MPVFQTAQRIIYFYSAEYRDFRVIVFVMIKVYHKSARREIQYRWCRRAVRLFAALVI